MKQKLFFTQRVVPISPQLAHSMYLENLPILFIFVSFFCANRAISRVCFHRGPLGHFLKKMFSKLLCKQNQLSSIFALFALVINFAGRRNYADGTASTFLKTKTFSKTLVTSYRKIAYVLTVSNNYIQRPRTMQIFRCRLSHHSTST